jgi:hypothetical protein
MKLKIKPGLLAVAWIVLLSLLLSCADFDNKRCLQTVSKKYPNAKVVWPIPDESYRYIVVDGSVVRYVTVMRSWDEITSDNVVSQ